MTIGLYQFLLFFKVFLRQLFLSISSTKFYYYVYKTYKGYGFKYLLTISFFSSMIYCTILLNIISNWNNCLNINTNSSKGLASVDSIVNQIPDIYYDGNTIHSSEKLPIYLLNKTGSKIAVIDSRDILTHSEKVKIPVVFTSKKILIFLTDVKNKRKFMLPITYSKIFGNNQLILTHEKIKNQLIQILRNTSSLIIFIIMPSLSIVIFAFILIENSFLISLVYFVTYMFEPRASIKQCIRLISFSSGIASLLHPFIISVPAFINLLWILKIWPNLLLFLALIRLREKY